MNNLTIGTKMRKHKKIVLHQSYRSMSDQARYVLFQELLHLAKDDQLDQAIIAKNKIEKITSKKQSN
tara:strand:- start:272 stop:472 length:201 start_codon:yes stop_codon:yes gene_type:complete